MTLEEHAQIVDAARGKFAMAQQMFETAADDNAIKSAIELANTTLREIPEIYDGNNFAHYPLKSEISLFIGHAFYRIGDDRNATLNYRRAVGDMNFALAGQGHGYEVAIGSREIFNLVISLQSLTIGTALEGNIDEARLACGTALGYANILNGKEQSPEIEKSVQALSSLQDQLGGNCPVYITEDPYSVWPYE